MQDWTDNCFDGSHDGMTDLQDMENNFLTLKSMFSALEEPASTIAFQVWGDLTSHILKFRDATDSEWYGALHADPDQKIWVYRDEQMDGWTIDEDVSDKILSIRGGEGSVCEFGGNDDQGKFQIVDDNHNHQSFGEDGVGVQQHTFNSGGSAIDPPSVVTHNDDWLWMAVLPWDLGGGYYWYDPAVGDVYTSGCVFTNEWRPLAATGTLQYMDCQ